MTNDTLLSVQRLSVSFPRSGRRSAGGGKSAERILDGVTFEVAPGQRIGILGESGSGKSTCARAIAGLLPAEAWVDGVVILNGKRLLDTAAPAQQRTTQRLAGAGSSRTQRRDFLPLQFVFQDPFSSMDPRQKIGKALAEVIRVRAFNMGRPAPDRPSICKKLSAALSEVGVDVSLAERYPHELSGGQLQRVAIARALLLQPQLLIADEAVSALDLSLQAQIVALLDRLVEQRKLAILFISHDLKLVRYFCERVIVLRNGKIADSGRTEDVFTRPESDYTHELIRAAVDKVHSSQIQ